MVILCELLLRTNDLSLQDSLMAHLAFPPTTNQFGNINRWRSDMEFVNIPLRRLIGEAQWRANPEAMLTLESWAVFRSSGAAPDLQDSNTLFISGHNPSFKEWRSCDTESNARYLSTRTDPNQGLYGVNATIPTDKSINTAPQRIRLSKDAVTIRLRLSPVSASGPEVTVQPVQGQSNPREFPHSVFKFTIRTLE
jgi:hypothetical protein